ncbi:MAG: beta-galactosidase, partial [Armatimonadota bacterium]
IACYYPKAGSLRDYWHNIVHSDLGLLSYLGKGVPDFQDRGFSKKATGWAQTKDKKFLVRNPCLNDPEWREAVKRAVQKRVRDRMRYGGCFSYCMGDEMSLTYYTRFHDFCFSKHCLARFRDWLKDLYGDLDSLNEAWETNFPTWGDVMPMTVEEVRGRDNAAPWADHRTFMNDTLADFFSFVQDSIREIDPEAKCGLSGTQAPEAGNGMDWWKLSKAFSHYHSYNTGWSDEMRRSFQRDTGVMVSPYRAGYWQAGARLEYQMFWCLLHDTQGISAWTTKLFFYPDLTFSESGRDTRANIRTLRGGIWDLIRNTRRQHDGIAIHYSQPSINAAFLLDKRQEIADVRAAWVKLLEDDGLQYDFLSYAQIENGALAMPRYKVLILPMSIALSAKEVVAIEKFVADGGTIIADQLCGLMDDHCRRQPRGLLDHLFGVERAAGEERPLPNEVILSATFGQLKAGDRIKVTAAEPRLRATTGQARGAAAADGGPPVLIVNEQGGSLRAYLNLDLSQYQSERKFRSPTERRMRQIVLALLAAAGIRPQVTVAFESGTLPHCEVVRYRSGEQEYVGILRDAAGEEKSEVATIRFPRKAHVYDVRQSKYLGQTGEVTVPIAPGQCRIFCLSRYRLPRPKIVWDPKLRLEPGEMVQFDITRAGPTALRQVIRVELVGPDGKVREWSRYNLMLGGPRPSAGVSFPIALNDPPGKWTIRATDVVSGQTAEATVTVK